MTTNTGNFDNPLILAIETSGRLGSVALAQGDKLLAESRFSGPMRHSAEIFPAITDLLSRFNKKPDQIEHIFISAGPGSFTGLRIAVTIAKTMALARQLATPIGEVSPAELNSARRTKIVAVDTLDCIAANVINPACLPSNAVVGGPLSAERCPLLPNERLAIILDAKRGQFFIAVYEKTQDSGPQTPDVQNDLSFPRKRESSFDCPLNAGRCSLMKILPDSLMTAGEFIDRFSNQSTALIGEGLVFYKDKFAHKNIRVLDEKFWNPSAANVHKLGWQLALQCQSSEGETSPTGGFADPLTLTPNYIRGPDVTIKQI